jgi:hypothetical protein
MVARCLPACIPACLRVLWGGGIGGCGLCFEMEFGGRACGYCREGTAAVTVWPPVGSFSCGIVLGWLEQW